MSWAHVVESATGAGIAMVSYTVTRKLAGAVLKRILSRKIAAHRRRVHAAAVLAGKGDGRGGRHAAQP